LVKIYGKQIVYSDAGTWHPEAHILLGLVVFTTWKEHSSEECSNISKM